MPPPRQKRSLNPRPAGRVVVVDFFAGRGDWPVVVNPVVWRDVERGWDAIKMIEADPPDRLRVAGCGWVLFVFHAEMPLADHRRLVASFFQHRGRGGAVGL